MFGKIFLMRCVKTAFGQTLVLESFWEKLRGLMFAPRVEKPLLFVFTNERSSENAIHSLFCPAFDAIFINSNGVVVGAFEVRSPKLFVCPEEQFKFLVETFPGDIKKREIKIGVKVGVSDWLKQ